MCLCAHKHMFSSNYHIASPWGLLEKHSPKNQWPPRRDIQLEHAQTSAQAWPAIRSIYGVIFGMVIRRDVGLADDCVRNPQISEEKPQRDKWLHRRDRPFHIEWCWSFNCSHCGLVLSPACVTYGCKHESRMTASFAWLTFAIFDF